MSGFHAVDFGLLVNWIPESLPVELGFPIIDYQIDY